MKTEVEVDEINWKLLEALQENGRLSYSELGRQVGLSATSVAERVQKLEEAGVISGYHASVNLEKVGLNLRAIVRLTSYVEKSEQFVKAVQEMPEVSECHSLTGSDCYILKLNLVSISHLEKVLISLKPYGQTATSVILSSPVTKRIIKQPNPTNHQLPASARRPAPKPKSKA